MKAPIRVARAGRLAPLQALCTAIAFQRDPLVTLARGRRCGGELFELTSVIGGRMLVVGTPDLALALLGDKSGVFLAGAANQRILPVLPENTVLTLDGDAHRARRRALASLFRGAALEAIAPVIGELVRQEIVNWPVGRPFAVLPRTRFLALCVASRLILGVDDHARVWRLEGELRSALRPYTMLAGVDGLRRLGRASPQAAARRCRRSFARGLESVVPEEAGGVLERFGADELLALLLAGHETTATALAWAILELARAPGIAEEMLREEDARDRPLLDAVIWETLRLRPPLIDIVRQAAAPAVLGGHPVRAHALLLIPPPLIHRCGAGPEPEEFDPRRFLAHPPDPTTWLPFGGGARRCLGASLAILELREAIPRIVSRFKLHPASTQAERAKLYGTALVPDAGARVVLELRT